MGMMYTNTLKYDMSGRRRRTRKPSGQVCGKYKPEFKPYVAPPETPRRDEGVIYRSVPTSATKGLTPRKESQKYTGTLIKGIATMHKSNAVPVIDQKQAEEISRMAK
jgi:hypothetical protein